MYRLREFALDAIDHSLLVGRMTPKPPTDFANIEPPQGDMIRRLRTHSEFSIAEMARILNIPGSSLVGAELDRFELDNTQLLTLCVWTFGRPSTVMGSRFARLDDRAFEKALEIWHHRHDDDDDDGLTGTLVLAS